MAQQQVHLAGMRETERERERKKSREGLREAPTTLTSLPLPESHVLCIVISMVALLLSDLPFNSLRLSIAIVLR